MQKIPVAVAALNQMPLAWEENKKNILRVLSDAKAAGAKLLCLPELCITGYGCEDAFHSPWLLRRALRELGTLISATKGICATFGLPVSYLGAIFNAVAVVCDGELLGFAAKKHLAGDGIYYEPRWFKPWPSGKIGYIEIHGEEYPIGDLIFDFKGIRAGFEICEDAWVPERAGINLARAGCDLIINPSASHFAFGKSEIRKRFVLEGSRAFGVAYLYSNLLGCESGRIIYDGDALIAQAGELLASGVRFSYQESVVTSCELDIDKIRLSRYRTSSFPVASEENQSVIGVNFSLQGENKKAPAITPAWENSEYKKEEEFTRAVSLGLFDYLRKSKNSGFIVSLSGGVDSSSASCLVNLMIHSAVAELGVAGFKQKFSYIPAISKLKSAKDITKALLTCVYQKTKNNSRITEEAAKEVAKEIGAEFYEFEIDELVESYVSLVEKNIKRKLSWEKDDQSLQNIQARVRAPGVWLLANLKNALLLSTSNRSEAAVGYTTMDGDTSGGLSPLGGIDKAFLRKWCEWLETTGPAGWRKISSLKFVNKQAPTAELKPLSKKQTDEGDLMPYTVLDKIERLAIRDKKSPQEIVVELGAVFEKVYSKKELSSWIGRFFSLWTRNQWKRERYAPSFHLDDENLDPKTWCRFPILSGGISDDY